MKPCGAVSLVSGDSPAFDPYSADFTAVGGEVLTGTTRVIVEAPQVIEPEATPVASPAAATPVA